eukprot:TRINITY_DN4657_c0_g1_i4.p2 TRINITY_DN4657_c0_g1~~TRINITY_DN4657_c0_g1_i4.p2  ORF type:complete len:214 (-),score=54.56 TRINITY_DN4657_c0_g1_i4:3307-3948(-)
MCIRDRDEAGGLLFEEWEAAGLVPADEADKRALLNEIIDTWWRPILKKSTALQILQMRAAKAVVAVPSRHAAELASMNLDQKNVELLLRGKEMQSDDPAADDLLKGDADERLVAVANLEIVIAEVEQQLEQPPKYGALSLGGGHGATGTAAAAMISSSVTKALKKLSRKRKADFSEEDNQGCPHGHAHDDGLGRNGENQVDSSRNAQPRVREQ